MSDDRRRDRLILEYSDLQREKKKVEARMREIRDELYTRIDTGKKFEHKGYLIRCSWTTRTTISVKEARKYLNPRDFSRISRVKKVKSFTFK